ncbi:MAG: hypothetical protein ABEK50_11970, partial [bacterium]
MPETFQVPESIREKWINAEDEFFAGLPTQQPDLYKKGIQSVRSLADALEDCFSPRELIEAYDKRDEDWARRRLEFLLDGLPRGLSLSKARNASFQLRLNELRPMHLQIVENSLNLDQSDEWITLFDEEGDYTGRSYLRRVDLSPSNDECLYLHPFMTEEGHYVHTYQRSEFDPGSGERPDGPMPDTERDRFSSPEDALNAFRSERQST